MKRSLVVLLCNLLVAAGVFAQNESTGFPPFASMQNSPFDSVNLNKLNVTFSIGLVTRTDRGVPFSAAVVYNSQFWAKSTSPVTWTPKKSWSYAQPVGEVTFQTNRFICGTGKTETTYTKWVYTDPGGTPHDFGVVKAIGPCPFSSTLTGFALEPSGYHIDITGSTIVQAPDGTKIVFTSGLGTLTDPNGNKISQTQPNPSESDWTDSSGRVSLKVISNGNPTSFQYLDTSGTYQAVSMTSQSMNVKTNFGWSPGQGAAPSVSRHRQRNRRTLPLCELLHLLQGWKWTRIGGSGGWNYAE